MLFRIEGKLYHPLKELIGRDAGEVHQDELFSKEAADVSQFYCPFKRSLDGIFGIDKIKKQVTIAALSDSKTTPLVRGS